MSTNDPFLQPIQPVDPREAAKVQASIAGDLRIGDEPRGENKIFPPEENKHLLAYAYASKTLYDIAISVAERRPSHFKGATEGDPLTQDLLNLRRLLKELTEVDRSKHAPYSQELSTLWHKLLHQFEAVLSGKSPSSLPLSEIQTLMQEIHSYPPATKYSFGYYLSDFAGKTWFPQPYMDLLYKIHTDYIKDPKKSALQKWLKLLDRLV